MNDFRRQFIEESLGKLAVLRLQLETSADASTLRDAFRIAHTIKGGAQIFKLRNPARVAAELEHQLAGPAPDGAVVAAGVDALAASFDAPDIDAVVRDEQSPSTAACPLFTTLPAELIDELSGHEFSELFAALERDELVATVVASFPDAVFGTEFPRFRAAVEASARVIAALPSNENGSELTYCFVVAGDRLPVGITELPAAVTNHAAPTVPALAEILARIIGHVSNAADVAGRAVTTSAIAHPVILPSATLGELFEILLHLTRNASEHAFETRGRIDIRVFEVDDSVRVTVTDDGRGIELEKVRARAVDRGLIGESESLSGDSIRELIFESGISTADKVTDFSGRGVGLDAVRSAVKRLGGKVEVSSRTGRTAFSVVFPNPKR